ncbi:hypothetical protein SLS58_007728 [Diplodia intermedia]|uniref:Uncharacterized protein n=1 Tax=Diplodia intermedia TaxID=856260 RepID=A0ABR3TJJ3_9PEZI
MENHIYPHTSEVFSADYLQGSNEQGFNAQPVAVEQDWNSLGPAYGYPIGMEPDFQQQVAPAPFTTPIPSYPAFPPPAHYQPAAQSHQSSHLMQTQAFPQVLQAPWNTGLNNPQVDLDTSAAEIARNLTPADRATIWAQAENLPQEMRSRMQQAHLDPIMVFCQARARARARTGFHSPSTGASWSGVSRPQHPTVVPRQPRSVQERPTPQALAPVPQLAGSSHESPIVVGEDAVPAATVSQPAPSSSPKTVEVTHLMHVGCDIPAEDDLIYHAYSGMLWMQNFGDSFQFNRNAGSHRWFVNKDDHTVYHCIRKNDGLKMQGWYLEEKLKTLAEASGKLTQEKEQKAALRNAGRRKAAAEKAARREEEKANKAARKEEEKAKKAARKEEEEKVKKAARKEEEEVKKAARKEEEETRKKAVREQEKRKKAEAKATAPQHSKRKASDSDTFLAESAPQKKACLGIDEATSIDSDAYLDPLFEEGEDGEEPDDGDLLLSCMELIEDEDADAAVEDGVADAAVEDGDLLSSCMELLEDGDADAAVEDGNVDGAVEDGDLLLSCMELIEDGDEDGDEDGAVEDESIPYESESEESEEE